MAKGLMPRGSDGNFMSQRKMLETKYQGQMSKRLNWNNLQYNENEIKALQSVPQPKGRMKN